MPSVYLSMCVSLTLFAPGGPSAGGKIGLRDGASNYAFGAHHFLLKTKQLVLERESLHLCSYSPSSPLVGETRGHCRCQTDRIIISTFLFFFSVFLATPKRFVAHSSRMVPDMSAVFYFVVSLFLFSFHVSKEMSISDLSVVHISNFVDDVRQ